MGERLDTDDEETREDLPAKKKRNKRRILPTIRNLKTLARVKRIRKEKRVQEEIAPVTLNQC